MNDGAHQGINAQRALDTILGGKESPTNREQENRASVRARIDACPWPCGIQKPTDYGNAADCIAKAFLSILADRPETPATDAALWMAAKDKWPEFDSWLGGASGFMVGWAVNCARWLNGEPPTQNPALVEVSQIEEGWK